MLNAEVLNNISENLNVRELAGINMRDQLNQSHRLATFLMGIADICLINIEDWSSVSPILQMVCLTFIKFKTQDENGIFQPAQCLFIDQEFKDISTLDWLVGQNDVIMELNKSAKKSSEIINKTYMDLTFNDVIKIKCKKMDEFFISCLENNECLEEYENNSVFNSVKLNYIWLEKSDNSVISEKYINQIDGIASKLFQMFSCNTIKKNASRDISRLRLQLENLTKLMKSENFFAENVETWRMQKLYEKIFKNRWKNRSDQLSDLIEEIAKKFRNGESWKMRELYDQFFEQRWKNQSAKLSKINEQISKKIGNGEILLGIDETFRIVQDEIMFEEEGIIKAISEQDIKKYFKQRLIYQMRDRINKKILAERRKIKEQLLRSKFTFSKQKLSQAEIDRCNIILQTFQTENSAGSNQLDDMFEQFCSSDLLFSNLESLKDDIDLSNEDQKLNYRCSAFFGFHSALDSENCEMVIQSLFPNTYSIDNWQFTKSEFLTIDVMRDESYFNTSSISIIEVQIDYSPLMSDLHNGFEQIIDDILFTKRGYDQPVDENVIRGICIRFKNSLDLTIRKYKIEKFVKPKFLVVCLVYAIFKMLLGRLFYNFERYVKQDDPLEHLEMQKQTLRKLFVLHINQDGVERSHSRLKEDFIFFAKKPFDTTSFESEKLMLTYMNRISINEDEANEVLGAFTLEDKNFSMDFSYHIHKCNPDQGRISLKTLSFF